MAHIIGVQPIPGAGDVFALLAFLSDKDACKARLAELKVMGDKVNALIEKVGAAEQIETMTSNAIAALEAAKSKLADATAEAEKLRETAKTEVAAQRAAFDELCLAWEKQRDLDRTEISKQREEMDRRATALRLAEETASRMAQDAARALEEARVMREDAETKLARLKAAIG